MGKGANLRAGIPLALIVLANTGCPRIVGNVQTSGAQVMDASQHFDISAPAGTNYGSWVRPAVHYVPDVTSFVSPLYAVDEDAQSAFEGVVAREFSELTPGSPSHVRGVLGLLYELDVSPRDGRITLLEVTGYAAKPEEPVGPILTF